MGVIEFGELERSAIIDLPLSDVGLIDLRRFLLAHEHDIANSMNDFDNLRIIFFDVFHRRPEYSFENVVRNGVK